MCVSVCVCVWIALNNRKTKKKKGGNWLAPVCYASLHMRNTYVIKKKKTNREKTRRHHTICSDCPLFSFFFFKEKSTLS